MGFINKLKAFFFNEKNVGIINIGDLLQIPGRDYFKDNQAAIDTIDKYNEIYINILKQRKLINAKELKIDNIHEDMNMNIELLLNSVYHDNENFGEAKNKDKYDNIIDLIKLRLYLNEINRMELLTIAKIIALKELEKGKRVPRIDRSVLNDELNNLMTSTLVFMGQKRAIELETTTFLRMMNEDEQVHLSKQQQMIKWNKEKDAFSEKLKLLVEIAKEYIKVDDILKMYQPDKVKIAIIKRRLEIYVFKHKEEILKLNEELEDIAKTRKTANNKSELLNRLNNLEKKYKIYDIYGRNVVKEEDINNFYKVKFAVLTCDIMSLEFNAQPLNDENPKAIQCYKNIIMEKIENIVMGNNPYIEEIFGDDRLKAIKEIVKSLKSNGRTFDLDKILNDINYLSLLLAFDTKDGINNYFNRRIPRHTWDIDTEYFNKNFNTNKYYNFDIILPISTIFEVLEPRNLKSCFSYGIYSLLKKDIDSSEYKLPEGITEINFYGNITEENDLDYFTRKLRKNGEGKTVIMPNSLTSLFGDLYKGLSIDGVVLNEGLCKIGSNVLKDRNFDYIVLPSTLESIAWGKEPIIDFLKNDDIRFNDYENSKILNNDFELSKFLYYSSQVHKTYKIISKESKVEVPHYRKCSSRVDWLGFPLGKEEWHTTYTTHIEKRYYPLYDILSLLHNITLYEGNIYDRGWVPKYYSINPQSYNLLECTSNKIYDTDSDKVRWSDVQMETKDLIELTEKFLEKLNNKKSNNKSRVLEKESVYRFSYYI